MSVLHLKEVCSKRQYSWKPELSVAFSKCKDGSNVVNFKLPDDGLALRSAAIVDGVPELRFDASCHVPTVLEEDVATVFRLVSENKRPEFVYRQFPPTHPFHLSRVFMQYEPSWLRSTSVGELLAEADWSMKCLHIGAKSNADKSEFMSWSKDSRLEGLATSLDFPVDGTDYSVIMSCESAKIQKGSDEIVFPEEPKIRITDGSRLLYSKYITQNYPSIAYYDEPKFLKVQELIKLILAVEWLYKEKGVRVSEEWTMKHTMPKQSEAGAILKSTPSKKPPSNMIPPLPTEFQRPCSDITVATREATMYNSLQKCGVEVLYGCYDFSCAEMKMFKKDATPCPPIKCLKLAVDCRVSFGHIHNSIKTCCYVTSQEVSQLKDKLLHLQSSTLHEEMSPFPELAAVVANTEVEDLSDDNGMEVHVSRACSILTPLGLLELKITSVMTATMDGDDKLYSGEDPNTPILPEIPGVCEAIVPGVKSWKELYNELSVPIPQVWQVPFIGFGEPTAAGGVTTKEFRVVQEPLQRRVVAEEKVVVSESCREGLVAEGSDQTAVFVERSGHPKRNFKMSKVDRRGEGHIELIKDGSTLFSKVSKKFRHAWKQGGAKPSVYLVFEISNFNLEKKFKKYQDGRAEECRNICEHFHGTSLACDIATIHKYCDDGECGICGISSSGLDRSYITRGRFGPGFYLTPHSSKADEYTSDQVHRAVLLCDVCPGRQFTCKKDDVDFHLPRGYDSAVSCTLPSPEIVVYEQDAVMPRYIIIYKKN